MINGVSNISPQNKINYAQPAVAKVGFSSTSKFIKGLVKTVDKEGDDMMEAMRRGRAKGQKPKQSIQDIVRQIGDALDIPV